VPDTVKSFGEIDGEDADIRVRGQHGTDGMQEGNDSSSGGSGGSKSILVGEVEVWWRIVQCWVDKACYNTSVMQPEWKLNPQLID